MVTVMLVSVGAAVNVPAGKVQFPTPETGAKVSDGELVAVIVPLVRTIGCVVAGAVKDRAVPEPLTDNAPFVSVSWPAMVLELVSVMVNPEEFMITFLGLLVVGHSLANTFREVVFWYSSVPVEV